MLRAICYQPQGQSLRSRLAVELHLEDELAHHLSGGATDAATRKPTNRSLKSGG